MNVPSEQERSITAESYSSNESLPAWMEEELYKTYLRTVSGDPDVLIGRPTTWKNRVRRNVVLGEISGKTANEVSPTRPLVTLLRPASLTFRPSLGAAVHFVRTDTREGIITMHFAHRVSGCGP